MITMRMAAVVILYKPTLEVERNICSYAAHIDKVYIIDNTEHSNPELFSIITAIRNAEYFHDRNNEGIAKRLNQAIYKAKNEGYEWLLTMDQDSFFSIRNLSNYLNCLSLYPNKESVAMFGLQYSKEGGHSINCSAEKTSQLITSGSVVNLTLVTEIGGFDEALFIDQVDLEYGYRAILKGYDLVVFKHIYLNHNLGTTSYHRSVKTGNRSPRSLHSPERLYYMARNYLIVHSKYRKFFPNELAQSRKDLLIRIKNNLLYNKKKSLFLKFLIRAILDYRKGQTGKLTHQF